MGALAVGPGLVPRDLERVEERRQGRKPAIPGDGSRAADWHITDYLEEMPEHGMAFIEYSRELNRAMRKYHSGNPDKEMVLMGHSIGA